MTPAQTLSWTQAQVVNRLRLYQALFLVGILADVAIGLWCLSDPIGFARVLHQPDPFPAAWLRIWGATWIAIQFLYFPGLNNPLFYRWPNWASIANKSLMAIVFLSCGRYFFLLAFWEIGFAVILSIAYYRLMLADVMHRP